MKHYRERIQGDLAATQSYRCPLCDYHGKDKQTIYRHYTGKHKVNIHFTF
jgi:transposase-like protein